MSDNHDAGASTGILIMNTGTPDAPTPEAIRPYLAEFLSDRHMISMPPALWQPILHLFILPSRPKKTAARYESIWTPEGSPFTLVSVSQRDKLAAELTRRNVSATVELAMRYGNPSTADALARLRAAGCTRLVVLPLFPQYATVTTQTCLDRVDEILDKIDWHPDLVAIDHYCDRPAYLDALAASIRAHWTWHEGSRLLFSFHSTLLADIEAGDPYRDQALATCQGVVERLGIPEDGWAVSWQCRFDSRKWLMPSPETVLEGWADTGVRDVAEVCPVFSTDCIETLVDCAVEQREHFENRCRARDANPQDAAGGVDRPGQEAAMPRYLYIPALNDSDAYISVLADVVEDALS